MWNWRVKPKQFFNEETIEKKVKIRDGSVENEMEEEFYDAITK